MGRYSLCLPSISSTPIARPPSPPHAALAPPRLRPASLPAASVPHLDAASFLALRLQCECMTASRRMTASRSMPLPSLLCLSSVANHDLRDNGGHRFFDPRFPATSVLPPTAPPTAAAATIADLLVRRCLQHFPPSTEAPARTIPKISPDVITVVTATNRPRRRQLPPPSSSPADVFVGLRRRRSHRHWPSSKVASHLLKCNSSAVESALPSATSLSLPPPIDLAFALPSLRLPRFREASPLPSALLRLQPPSPPLHRD